MQRPEISDYTKHYIVEALLKLMNKKDFRDIAITEVVKVAGVGRATFYRNFTDKESVIKYHLNNTTSKFESSQKYQPRSEEDYYDVIIATVQTMKKNKELLQLLVKSNLEYMFLDFLNSGYSLDFSRGNKPQNSLLPYGYAGANYNISLQWIKSDCKETVEEVAEALFILSFGKEKYAAFIADKKL